MKLNAQNDGTGDKRKTQLFEVWVRHTIRMPLINLSAKSKTWTRTSKQHKEESITRHHQHIDPPTHPALTVWLVKEVDTESDGWKGMSKEMRWVFLWSDGFWSAMRYTISHRHTRNKRETIEKVHFNVIDLLICSAICFSTTWYIQTCRKLTWKYNGEWIE